MTVIKHLSPRLGVGGQGNSCPRQSHRGAGNKVRSNMGWESPTGQREKWGFTALNTTFPCGMTENAVRRVKLSLYPCYLTSRLNPPVHLKGWQCLGQASSVPIIPLLKHFTLWTPYGCYSLISGDQMCLSHNVIRRYKSYFNILLCMHTMKWEEEGFGQRKEKQATLSKQQNTSHKRKKEKKGGAALENTCVWKSTWSAATWRTSQGFGVYQKRTWAWVSDVFSTDLSFAVVQSGALQRCLTMVWLVLSVLFNQQQWQNKEECQNFVRIYTAVEPLGGFNLEYSFSGKDTEISHGNKLILIIFCSRGKKKKCLTWKILSLTCTGWNDSCCSSNLEERG